MTFDEVLPYLKEGHIATRESYDDSYIIFMQIPADISSDKVLTMTSVPDKMKVLLACYELGIKYRSQFIIYDISNEEATYFVPDGDDICADDWVLVNVTSFNG